MRSVLRVLAASVWIAVLITLSGFGGGATLASAETAGALLAVVERIDQALQKAIASADVVTANKLEAAQTRVSALLREAEALVKEGERASNEAIGNATRDAHLLVSDLRRTVRSSQRSIFQGLNETLAVSSQLLDSFPIVKVEPYVASVLPSRIPPDLGDRMLTIYGFLPGTPGSAVKIKVSGAPVASARGPQGGIRFELPAALALKEQSFIPLQISVTRPSGLFGWFSKTTEIEDRVYVGAAKPYACKVSRMRTNPEYLVEVAADKAFSDEATTQKNAARGSVNRTLSARNLFLATVSNAQDTFDLDSVRIKDPGASFAKYGDCEHFAARGTIVESTPELMSYDLYAPEVGRHLHSGWSMQPIRVLGHEVGKTQLPYSYYVDAGGTKSVIALKPRFLAAKKGAAPLVAGSSESVAIGWDPAVLDAKESLQDGWSIHVTCDFRDGDEKWSTGPMILRAADPVELGRGFAARIADAKLYLVPLAFGEQYER